MGIESDDGHAACERRNDIPELCALASGCDAKCRHTVHRPSCREILNAPRQVSTDCEAATPERSPRFPVSSFERRRWFLSRTNGTRATEFPARARPRERAPGRREDGRRAAADRVAALLRRAAPGGATRGTSRRRESPPPRPPGKVAGPVVTRDQHLINEQENPEDAAEETEHGRRPASSSDLSAGARVSVPRRAAPTTPTLQAERMTEPWHHSGLPRNSAAARGQSRALSAAAAAGVLGQSCSSHSCPHLRLQHCPEVGSPGHLRSSDLRVAAGEHSEPLGGPHTRGSSYKCFLHGALTDALRPALLPTTFTSGHGIPRFNQLTADVGNR
nr:uncharacterized protein LOC105885001 isoform X2 [Microcebus murinus]